MNHCDKAARKYKISHLLVESWRVRADVEVGFSSHLVNVLQTVSISVHDETRVVVKQDAHAVVTQLVA